MVEALPAVTYIDEPVEGDDINATMPFVSPQIEIVLGYPPERFLQDSRFWFDLMHPDDYARLRVTGDLSVSNVWESTQEYRMRHADGHWVWVQDTSRPVFDDQGELIFFQGFLMDVSTRHEAEERLRAAEPAHTEALLAQLAASLQKGGAAGPLRWLRASVGQAVQLIPVEAIDFLRSDQKYTLVAWRDDARRAREAVLRMPLTELTPQLDAAQFAQVHRSVVVNLSSIDRVVRGTNETADIHLKGRDDVLPVSRNYLHLFKQM